MLLSDERDLDSNGGKRHTRGENYINGSLFMFHFHFYADSGKMTFSFRQLNIQFETWIEGVHAVDNNRTAGGNFQ